MKESIKKKKKSTVPRLSMSSEKDLKELEKKLKPYVRKDRLVSVVTKSKWVKSEDFKSEDGDSPSWRYSVE